jgi:hypothetical protein
MPTLTIYRPTTAPDCDELRAITVEVTASGTIDDPVVEATSDDGKVELTDDETREALRLLANCPRENDRAEDLVLARRERCCRWGIEG